MNPGDFATVAEELLGGGTPAHNRTAVGRAYYAVFNTALLLLSRDIRFPKTGDKHSKLRYYLANCGHPAMNKVSSKLGDLKYMRTLADYEMHATEVENSKTATLSVTLAKQLNEQLNSILNGPDRSTILAGIAEYRAKVNDL